MGLLSAFKGSLRNHFWGLLPFLTIQLALGPGKFSFKFLPPLLSPLHPTPNTPKVQDYCPIFFSPFTERIPQKGSDSKEGTGRGHESETDCIQLACRAITQGDRLRTQWPLSVNACSAWPCPSHLPGAMGMQSRLGHRHLPQGLAI